jgi:hypothetical protein
MRQQALGALDIRRMQGIRAPQLAFALGALLGQYVAPVRVITFEPAGAGLLETLRSASVGFQLWHSNLGI